MKVFVVALMLLVNLFFFPGAHAGGKDPGGVKTPPSRVTCHPIHDPTEIFKTLPPDTCFFTNKIWPSDEEGNPVKRPRGATGGSSTSELVSPSTGMIFYEVRTSSVFIGNKMGTSKIILTKQRVGTNPDRWVVKNQVWARDEENVLVPGSLSPDAERYYAQAGGNGGFARNNTPPVQPPVAQQPQEIARGCSALSGLAKIACETASTAGKLGVLGR